MIEKIETKDNADIAFSGIIDAVIKSPVIKQDRPIKKRKKVANPKNTISTTSSKTPMIKRLS